MSKKKAKRPIDIHRNSAWSTDVGTKDDDSPISGMISCANRLIIIKEQGVYEVEHADQIDPERKNPNVPNASKRLFKYGSNSEFVGRTFITGNGLFNDMYLRGGVGRDRLMPILLVLVIKLAQLRGIVEDYVERESTGIAELDNTNAKAKGRGSVAVPDIHNLDSMCKSFFIQVKHELQDLLKLANELFGINLKRGFFSNLGDLMKERYGVKDTLYLLLSEAEDQLEFLRITRNCFEHEKPTEKVVISNFRINEKAEIVSPTIKVVHPDLPDYELHIRPLLEGIFAWLVDFSEALIVGMVDRNFDSSTSGLPIQVGHFPGGYKGNPHVRFGLGIIMGEKLVPFG